MTHFVLLDRYFFHFLCSGISKSICNQNLLDYQWATKGWGWGWPAAEFGALQTCWLQSSVVSLACHCCSQIHYSQQTHGSCYHVLGWIQAMKSPTVQSSL